MVDNIQRKLRQMVSELQAFKTPPRELTDEVVYNYLFDLQESGEVNMFGSVPYIKRTFGVNEDIASKYLVNYIENYDELYKMWRVPVPEIQPLEVTVPLSQVEDVLPPTVQPVVEIVQKKRGAKRYDEMTEEERAAAKAKRQENKAKKAVAALPAVESTPVHVPEPPKAKRVIKIKK